MADVCNLTGDLRVDLPSLMARYSRLTEKCQGAADQRCGPALEDFAALLATVEDLDAEIRASRRARETVKSGRVLQLVRPGTTRRG